MKINFYLRFYKGIAGGFKVVYQYSNYLVERGHDVVIYYDLNNGKNRWKMPRFLMTLVRKIIMKKYPYYFKLDKRVKQISMHEIKNKKIRDADISICTSPQTAHLISGLDDAKGKKCYFIQAYEDWQTNSIEELHETYNMNYKNIVISNWLKEIVDKYSNKSAEIVENGIDLKTFKVKESVDNRNKYSVAMIYHEAENKGCEYGIKALMELKETYNDLIVNMYGAPSRPNNLPEWFNYTQGANEETVVDILNKSSVFVCTSFFEGFGLPGLEAMACGCALVTTDCCGPLEYANDNNSIICEIKSSKAIVDSIKKVFDDDLLKKNIVKNSLKTVADWDIEKSKEKFEKCILG